MKFTHEGQSYEFPNDTSLEEMNSFFGTGKSSPPAQDQKPESPKDRMLKQLEDKLGFNRTPIDTIKDVATGLGNAGQNVGNFMYDRFKQNTFGPMAEGIKQSGNEVPEFVQNQLNSQLPQVDIQKAFGTEKGNPLTQLGAQFAPGIIAGGASIPGQIGSNALFGASQGSPEQENLFGILPKGRTGAAIEGGVMGALPLAGKAIKKGFNYLRPGKSAKEFMESIGKVGQESPKTINEAMEQPKASMKTGEENIEEIGKRVKLGKESAEREALIPKTELQKTELNSKLFSGRENSSYLNKTNVSKNYDEGLKKLHMDYEKNPTFLNSDRLKSALSKEQRRLQDKINSKIYQESDRLKLNRITENEKALIKDQDNFFKTLPESKQKLYKEFREKWAKNVAKYEKASTKPAKSKVIRNLSEGNYQEIGKNDIQNAFRNPSKKTENILRDIGPSGVDNIVYNSLLDVPLGDAKALANAILEMRNNKGMSKYFTKEHEDFAKSLLKRVRNRKIGAGAATAGGSLYLGKKFL